LGPATPAASEKEKAFSRLVLQGHVEDAGRQGAHSSLLLYHRALAGGAVRMGLSGEQSSPLRKFGVPNSR